MDALGIVMAGGRGERLYPLTKDRAKPAVPFGGKYRIIDFVLSNFVNSGICSIYLTRPAILAHTLSTTGGRANLLILRRRFGRKKIYIVFLMFVGLSQWGCEFVGGAATGALLTGAGYEIQAKRQMDKLEDDYKHEKILRREYEDRKNRSRPARLSIEQFSA